MGRAVGVLAAVVSSAVLYGLAFPPRPHPLLSWIALAPLFAVLRRMGPGRAALLGWLWTFLMTCTVNDWFPRGVSGYFGQSATVGLGLFLGVTTLTAGLQYACFSASCAWLGERGRFPRPFLLAATWVAADMARLRLFGGDPWALAGYAQVPFLPIVQVADTTGVHGVTFLVVMANAALAEATRTWMDDRRQRSPFRDLLPIPCLVALAASYGLFRLHTASMGGGDPISVGVAQAHLPLGSTWKPSLYGRNLDAYFRLTAEIDDGMKPRLVVWPEAAMTFFLADEPDYRNAIGRMLEVTGAELIAGGPFQDRGARERYLNSAFLISPGGEIRGRYDKQLLLPFAEYFPLHGIDLLRRSFGRVREFSPGGPAELLRTSSGPAGIVICNEAFFPEPASERVRDGAAFLVNLSNDSWLSDPKYSEPAFDMVRLRAIEQRRWIVRASTSGPSALISPTGDVAERTPLLSSATVTGQIRPARTRTPYSRIGDAFGWLCVCAWLGSVMTAAGRAR